MNKHFFYFVFVLLCWQQIENILNSKCPPIGIVVAGGVAAFLAVLPCVCVIASIFPDVDGTPSLRGNVKTAVIVIGPNCKVFQKCFNNGRFKREKEVVQRFITT